MLRNLFVALIILVGVASCVRGPFYALLFYIWIAYFRPEVWLWTDWISVINLSFVVGIAALALTLLFIGQTRFRFTWPIALLMLFFFDSLFAVLISQDPAWSWTWWSEFAKVLVIGYLITLHTSDERRLRIVLGVLALSLGFETAKQGWAQFILNPGATNINTHPALGDNNGVALGMFMLAPLLAALGATANRFWERGIYWFLGVGVIFRGITTYSRGGFLSAAVFAVVYFVRSRHRLRVLAATVLVAGLILPVMPQVFWDRMQTITKADQSPDESAASRLYFWKVAVAMAKDHALTGVGFNGFSRSYSAYDRSRGAYGENRAVHSTWFGVLAEMGVPGLSLLVVLVLVALLNCRYVRRAARKRPDLWRLDAYALALSTSFIVFVVGGSFINAQYSEMMWHLLCLTIALRQITQDALMAAGGDSIPVASRPHASAVTPIAAS